MSSIQGSVLAIQGPFKASVPFLTFAPGTLYYVAVTLTNSQSSPTPSNFQQSVTINPSNYSSYINSTLTNVNWQDGKSNILKSWRENGTSNTDTADEYWINLGSLVIPANGTLTIYLCFYATSANEIDGVTTGVAPTLTSTYGALDNGANVFTFYDNFSGTSLSSKWKIYDQDSNNAVSVNNALTISATGTPNNVIVYSASSYAAQFFEMRIISVSVSGGSPSTFVLIGSSQTFIYHMDPSYQSGFTGADSANTGVAQVVNSSDSISNIATGLNNPATPFTYGVDWYATGGEVFKFGPNSYPETNSTNTLPTSFYYGAGTSGGSYIATAEFQWARSRFNPPGAAVMPTASFGPVTGA